MSITTLRIPNHILIHIHFRRFSNSITSFRNPKYNAYRSIVVSKSNHNRTIMTSSSSSSMSAQDKTAAAYRPGRPRRFMPLNFKGVDGSGSGSGSGGEVDGEVPGLRGIVFDVDGTMCLPQNYMFGEMRAALNISKPTDILDHIQSLSDEPDNYDKEDDSKSTTSPSDSSKPSSPRSRAVAAIQQIERTAMTTQEPQPGLVELMTYLETKKIPKSICTRNFPMPVDHLIETILGDLKDGFDMIITRDTKGIKPKPSPEGLWAIARQWGLDHDILNDNESKNGTDVGPKTSEKKDELDPLEMARRYLGKRMIMVGDSIDDMAAGYRAGAATVLLVNEENKELAEHEYTDLAVGRLDELIDVLENGFVGKN